MSDYGADWPLWEGGMIGPEDLDLSAGLAADLKAWQDLFEDYFHWESGWRTPEAKERYARDADTLLNRLREELGPGFDVQPDAWPVNSRSRLTRWRQRFRRTS
ncbi:MAG: hypothetical protein ACRDPT_02960 [Streptomycetales bacterium]